MESHGRAEPSGRLGKYLDYFLKRWRHLGGGGCQDDGMRPLAVNGDLTLSLPFFSYALSDG